MNKTGIHRHYYHISNYLYKHNITLKPRDWGFNRDSNEPKIKRICVSPTIEQCLIAICTVFGQDFINIYRTKNKCLAYYPYDILDSDITGEMWLLDDTEFEKIGYIDTNNISDILEDIMSKKFGLGDSMDKVLNKMSREWQKKMLIQLFNNLDSRIKYSKDYINCVDCC